MNETILPTDHKRAGQIVDDELHRALVLPLQPGVTLHAVIDACHSGTALDLPYRTTTRNGRFDWKVSKHESADVYAWFSRNSEQAETRSTLVLLLTHLSRINGRENCMLGHCIKSSTERCSKCQSL